MPINWLLYNCAHQESSIKSTDGCAWIRVLGSFCSKTLALEHARKLSAADPGIEIRVAPENEFSVMLRSKYNDSGNVLDMITRERETKKHQSLVELHSLIRKHAFEDTARNAEQRQMGELKYSPEERVKAHKEEFGELQLVSLSSEQTEQEKEVVVKDEKIQNESSVAFLVTSFPKKEVFPAVKPILKDLEPRMQKYAAISLIPDYEHFDYCDSLVQHWEKKRDEEFAKIHNAAFLNTVKTFRL